AVPFCRREGKPTHENAIVIRLVPDVRFYCRNALSTLLRRSTGTACRPKAFCSWHRRAEGVVGARIGWTRIPRRLELPNQSPRQREVGVIPSMNFYERHHREAGNC